MYVIYINIYTFSLVPCEKAVGVFVEDGFENQKEVSFFSFFFKFLIFYCDPWIWGVSDDNYVTVRTGFSF